MKPGSGPRLELGVVFPLSSGDPHPQLWNLGLCRGAQVTALGAGGSGVETVPFPSPCPSRASAATAAIYSPAAG